MLSKEIVQRAIHFQYPPRLPVMMDCFGVSDVSGVPIKPPDSFQPAVEGQDEWGCVWAHTDVKNMGQVKGHPLEDVGRLDKHRFPDYTDDSRYVNVGEALDRFDSEGKYITAGIFMVARMSPLYELSLVALSTILIIGAVTALFMGLLGIVQPRLGQLGFLGFFAGLAGHGQLGLQLGQLLDA